MVRISEELIRKRAEHNNGILHDLHEVTLHQFEIEKIELLGTLCRHLRILYLQNNIIGKIGKLIKNENLAIRDLTCDEENLHRLKELEYLNLAVNNIEVIENLEQCESLYKLDLTVNFIDIDHLELSINNLICCHRLRELYLLGNPCTQFEGWRTFVIDSLPQLKILDGLEITKSERIRAKQEFQETLVRLRIAADDRAQKRKSNAGRKEEPEDENLVAHTPEARTKMYRELAESKDDRNIEKPNKFSQPVDPIKETRKKLAQPASEGTRGELPRQRNQGHWKFHFEEDSRGFVFLSIGLPKFLDTSMISVTIQPLWVQVIVKNESILLHLPAEVRVDECSTQRITTTGALVLKMPKVYFDSKASAESVAEICIPPIITGSKDVPKKSSIPNVAWKSIVKRSGSDNPILMKEVSDTRCEDFEADDGDVPPLE